MAGRGEAAGAAKMAAGAAGVRVGPGPRGAGGGGSPSVAEPGACVCRFPVVASKGKPHNVRRSGCPADEGGGCPQIPRCRDPPGRHQP